MANKTQKKIIQEEGVEAWNEWRRKNPGVTPDLIAVDINGANLTGVNLNNANLAGANLNNANLTGANLNNANLTGVNLNDANLTGAKLSNAKLKKTKINHKTVLDKKWRKVWEILNQGAVSQDLYRADLSGVELNGANLSGANLSSADLNGANLSGANLSKVNLTKTNLNGTNLSGANLSKVNLTKTNFNGANITQVNLSGANLSHLDLTKINLNGTNLTHANLSETNLSHVDISKTNLSYANLSYANLTHANLSYANLSHANLSHANLTRTNINGTNFSQATLNGVDLSGNDLRETNLKSANLSGTDLNGSILSRGQIKKLKLFHIPVFSRFFQRGTNDRKVEENFIEELVQNFRGKCDSGGKDYSDQTSPDLLDTIADVFNLLLYRKIKLQSQTQIADCTYIDNQTFWHDALSNQLFEGMKITLKGFHLTEWMPFAPGSYFTPESIGRRKNAQRYLTDNEQLSQERIYNPTGKQGMILGGIGSVRLASKVINSKNIYFLGASSTGITHQGIPLSLLESKYHQVIKVIQQQGGCLVNLVGSLRIISLEHSLITYRNQIPKYCLLVDNIEIIRPSFPQELMATAAVMSSTKTWCYCSFSPAINGDLTRAVSWIKKYKNYFRQGSIISDFDEHCQHFHEDIIDFSISNLFEGNINLQRLNNYGFTINIEKLEELIMNKNVEVEMIVKEGGQVTNMVGKNKGGIHNYTANQNLVEAATEIQQLLEQLSQTHPTSTNKERNAVVGEVVDQIESDPKLKARVINSLKAGGIEAFKEAIDHPLVNILMATIEGWRDIEPE